MRLLDESGLDDLAVGSAVLGGGGGGDPYIGQVLARQALREHGPVTVVDVDELPDDAQAVFSFLHGAPGVMVEKHPSSRALAGAVAAIERRIGRAVTHLISIEAGGLNSVTPVGVAARLGLPLVDADGMGRAFPSVAMVTPTLYGIAAAPMVQVDGQGSALTIEDPSNARVEHFARSITVAMGCSTACAAFPMSGRQVKEACIAGTLTLAQELGRTLREAREAQRDPIAALLEHRDGRRLLGGKVMSVDRRTEGGWTVGEVEIEGLDEDAGASMTVRFQNENLVALRDGETVASVPDIVVALDADTGEPFTTERLRYGFRVAVVAMPCDPRWTTPEGLALTGPRAYGFDFDYRPLRPDGSRARVVTG